MINHQRTPVIDGSRKSRAASVRVRTTVGAVLVVGVALLAGSIGLVTLLDRTLTNDVRVAALVRAGEVAAVLESSGDPGSLAVANVEEQLIQVLDQRGRDDQYRPDRGPQPDRADPGSGAGRGAGPLSRPSAASR